MDQLINAFLLVIIAMLFIGAMQLVDALILIVGGAVFLPQVNGLDAAF